MDCRLLLDERCAVLAVSNNLSSLETLGQSDGKGVRFHSDECPISSLIVYTVDVSIETAHVLTLAVLDGDFDEASEVLQHSGMDG